MNSKDYMDPKDYSLENQIQDMLRYGDVTTTDDGLVMKDHPNKSCVEINIPADNKKGHISYDCFYDENGKYTSFKPHDE